MGFTFEYSQPESYHFCQDSILFPKVVSDFEREHVTADSKVLDLCAGCGVIGFELRYHLPLLRVLDFVEVQSVFRPHLEANRELTQAVGARIFEVNYGELRRPTLANTYDLIVSNPPYFFKEDGALSDSDIKNRCRFFIDSDFETLIEGVLHSLAPEGRAYLLVKAGAKHGRNAFRLIQMILQARADVSVVANVRGTDVVKIKKPRGLAASVDLS